MTKFIEDIDQALAQAGIKPEFVDGPLPDAVLPGAVPAPVWPKLPPEGQGFRAGLENRPPKARLVAERLRRASIFGKARVARNAIGSLNDAELKQLDPDTRLELLQALTGQRPVAKLADLFNSILGGKSQKAMARLYRAMPLDTAFLAHQQKDEDELVQFLSTNQHIKDAAANWAKLDKDARAKVLTYAILCHSKAYGYQPPRAVKFYSSGPSRGGITLGRFNPLTRNIGFNTHGKSYWNSFPDILNTALHENSHNHQLQMGLMAAFGMMDPADPRYAQARVFGRNMYIGGYLSAGVTYQDYRTQPVENHAFAQGEALARRILGKGPKVPFLDPGMMTQWQSEQAPPPPPAGKKPTHHLKLAS